MVGYLDNGLLNLPIKKRMIWVFIASDKGDIVLISKKDPLKETPLEGTIYSTSRTSIKIVFSDTPKDIRKHTWRLDKGANRIAFDRMRDALNSIFDEDGGVPLRDLLLGMVHDPPGTASLIPELGGVRG
jgi:hypothetical protein